MSRNVIVAFIFGFWLLSGVCYRIYNASPALDLSINILNVGQGDAVHIAKDNLDLLVDGGGNHTIDAITINNLFDLCAFDLIFLTHPHADHYFGLTRILSHCETDLLMFNDVSVSSTTYDKFRNIASHNKTFRTFEKTVFEYDRLRLVTLWPPRDFDAPENMNNTSTVLLLDYGDFEMLLTGDAEQEVWKHINLDLISEFLDGRLEVYKAPHHGAINGLDKSLLHRLRPMFCVISVGENNTFGHPSAEILDFYEEIGCTTLRTDIHGNVVFTVKSL